MDETDEGVSHLRIPKMPKRAPKISWEQRLTALRAAAIAKWKTIFVKTHLEECTTRYLGFKCFLFSVYRVYPEVEDGRGTFDLACAFAVLFGVWKPGSVLLTAEVVW